MQAAPIPPDCFEEYDRLIEMGTDHFSFCVEFEDPEVFARICPGKAATLGQDAFYHAMEYTVRRLGRGRVSGEIIAGVEPIARTMQAIDRIVATGAFPTVCIFRPLRGSDMEDVPPPDPLEMREVMAYQYEACRRARIPIGVIPGIDVSLVVEPEDARDLWRRAGGRDTRSPDAYDIELQLLRSLARPYVAWKCKPRGLPWVERQVARPGR